MGPGTTVAMNPAVAVQESPKIGQGRGFKIIGQGRGKITSVERKRVPTSSGNASSRYAVFARITWDCVEGKWPPRVVELEHLALYPLEAKKHKKLQQPWGLTPR